MGTRRRSSSSSSSSSSAAASAAAVVVWFVLVLDVAAVGVVDRHSPKGGEGHHLLTAPLIAQQQPLAAGGSSRAEASTAGSPSPPFSSSMTFERCLESATVVSEVFCLPSDYRKDVPPPTSSPIHVYINLPLSEISVIDDQHSQISIRLYYKLLWPEPRMVLNASADWSSGKRPVGAGLIEHFWTPDLIIHDLVEFNKPEMVSEVAALQIKRENAVYYKLRADLTIVCKGMEFGLYPFDKHVCYLKLTSFGHTTEQMILKGGFTYTHDNQRELLFDVQIAEVDGSGGVFVGRTNNYSMYSLEIRLTRFVTPYLLNVYLPTGIFVIMSWVSFIIPVDIIAARITLLITLCLVLINSFNIVTEKIPVAREETAMEFWVSGCICLVFAALSEYAFILFKMTRLKRRRRRQKEMQEKYRDVVRAVSPEAEAAMQQGERLFDQEMQDLSQVQQEQLHLQQFRQHPQQQQEYPAGLAAATAATAAATTVLDKGARGHVVVRSAATEQEKRSKRKKRASSGQPQWRDTLHTSSSHNSPEHSGYSGNKVRGTSTTKAPSSPTLDPSFEREWRKYHDSFDEQARIVYPSLFAAFNLGYWLYYMYFVVSRH